jgi:hypothetical protein
LRSVYFPTSATETLSNSGSCLLATISIGKWKKGIYPVVRSLQRFCKGFPICTISAEMVRAGNHLRR